MKKLHLLLNAILASSLLLPFAFESVPAKAQSAAVCGQDVVVVAGDTLATIAGRTLGNQLAYPRIVEATNAAAAVDPSYANIANPNIIAVGWKLCIPGADNATAAPVPAAPAAAPSATVGAAPVGSAASAVATPAPAQGSAAESTASATSPALTPEAEPTREPGPNGEHPLSIAYLRSLEYPGSPITIEQTLEPGVNYNRYIVSYRSEGLKINALLTVPFGEKPATGWPVVIFNHGYIAPEVYRTTERYVAYVDGFARNGYIVLRSDYRGHAFSEGEANGAYGSPDYTIDVLNAVASIKQYPDADPNRIGMWGHSMGGYITLRAMLVDDDIKAGVIWAGVVGSYDDLLNNWRRRTSDPIPSTIPQRARRWRDQLLEEFGTPQENPEFWNSISANTFVAELSGPIQLHHGTADTSVPVDFSQTLHNQILAVNGVSELYTYPNDDHNIATYFSTAMGRSITFFDTYVKPLTPPTAAPTAASATGPGTGPETGPVTTQP
jgi:dienelactone hydrolase